MQIDRIGGLSGSIAIKVPCRVATTANIALSGLLTVDDVVLVAGDRVLVKNQTTGSENGIYIAATGTWTRSPDFDGSRDVAKGTLVGVTSGTVAAGQLFTVTTADPITIGTTGLTFALHSVNSALGITNTPAGNIAATTVQAALNELDAEKALLAGSASQNFAANALTVAGIATFSGNPLVTNTGPRYELTQSNGAVDNKRWDIVASGEAFAIRAINDANTVAGDIIVTQRTGTTIDSVTIGGTAVIIPGTLGVTGGFGCNTKPAQVAYPVGAAATDLASVIALANNIRLALIANGIAS